MPRKLIIAGGSGSIGQHLIDHFTGSFDEIVVLSRSESEQKKDHRIVQWDATEIGDWAAEIEHAEAVINLTGKSIQCRFTEANKRILKDSRINSTAIIGKAISLAENPPSVWINASGASIYPEAFDVGSTEAVTEVGTSFLAQLSLEWEAAVHTFDCPGTRKIIARICPVLDAKSGFLPPLIRLSKLGAGGAAGNGKQMISWIHYVDLVQSFSFLLSDENLEGVFNLGSPDPRSNANFMRSVRKQVKMPFGLPAPAFAIRMSSALIGMDPSLILDSAYVLPARLQTAGFEFKFGNLEAALQDLG